jgi:hypothetical protein
LKKQGRPLGSNVRQNIVEILFFKKKAYAYEIYKDYIKLFPKVTLRLIYYHLNMGSKTKEFEIESIKKQPGDYSWGENAERIYYKLGKNASPKLNTDVKKYFEKKK